MKAKYAGYNIYLIYLFACLFIYLLFIYLFVCYMFVDGQKIAKKLCTQIAKETREIRSLLQELITIQDSLQADAMCTSEALDRSVLRLRLQSPLGMRATGERLEERREIIQAYLTVARSMDELEL